MASSSSSIKYDVFLNFRGEDIRENFASHLFATLSRKKINTFVDESINKGEIISNDLLNAIIEGSKISIIIFSKNYGNSRWCLDELIKILDCKKTNGQIVVPVFYHVHPSDVRKQTGSFGDAFVEHKNSFRRMPGKVQNWRNALTEASYLSGYESMKIRPEAKLVDVIVKDVLKKLENMTASTDFKGLIGINSRIEKVKSLLHIGLPYFGIVGIWMGGIGKTTLAEVIFKQVSSNFEGKCFMANVREKSKREGGLENLQKQVLSYLLEESLEKGGPNIPQYTTERLRCMKVFIVLDDVNTLEQLECLVGGVDRFGSGSRIIVTSRTKEVLVKFRVDNIYEVEKFNNSEALKLFCNYAFRQDHFSEDLIVLSKIIVDYAKGNPLVLKVLGSFFHGKSKLDWETALYNLHRISSPKIYNVLKISYEELSLDEKSIFLDIACFFNGEDKGHVIEILDNPEIHYIFNVLIDKSLITLSSNKLIKMHDLLQEMGQEIVRQESIKDPGKRSRLWNHEDIYYVLKKNKGTDSIEGIFLDISKIRDLHLNSEAFAKMTNLRFLKFYIPKHSDVSITSYRIHLPQGLDYLCDELRYFHWYGYPLRTLPMSFSPDNLIELNLPYSEVQQLWEGRKEAFKLKFIDLQHSQLLTKIPDALETPNLERISLLNCISLSYIPPYIQNFDNLGKLSLEGCKSIRCFPSNIRFRSPIKINFSFCINLSEFPQISGNLTDLDLRYTAIEVVPSSVESLTSLEKLNLSNCKSLKIISTNICKLKSLCWLDLDNCSNLQSFPEILEQMVRLEYINLDSTRIKELPSSFEHLEGLTELSLIDCSELVSLPENLRHLKSLKFINGEKSSITKLPSSITDLKELETLLFYGCRGLVLPPLSGLSNLRELDLSDCSIMEIPQDIGYLCSLELLDMRGNDFGTLPASMKQLSRLRSLYLRDCNMLQSLPELPLFLKHLDASNCKLLQLLPEIPSCLEELHASELHSAVCDLSQRSDIFSWATIQFGFNNCPKLNEKATNILADSQLRIQHMAIAALKLFHFYRKEFSEPLGISIWLPGSGIPDWFSNQSSLSSTTIQLPKHCFNRNFFGFALCAVIGNEGNSDTVSGEYFRVKCSCHFEIKTPSKTEHFDITCYLSDYVSTDLDHVVLGFDPYWNVRLPDGEHHTTVKFEFTVYNNKFNSKFKEIEECYKVKRCGVCPVYAHCHDTKPNTFVVNMLPPAEEERDEFHEMTCRSESVEEGVQLVSREQIKTPQFFRKRGAGLLAFLVFVYLLFIVSLIRHWKLASDQ